MFRGSGDLGWWAGRRTARRADGEHVASFCVPPHRPGRGAGGAGWKADVVVGPAVRTAAALISIGAAGSHAVPGDRGVPVNPAG